NAIALAAASMLGGVSGDTSAQVSGPNLHTPGEMRYVKGRILVQPRAGLKGAELEKKLKAHGGRRVGHIRQINVHIVELPSQANERAVTQALRSDRHIKFAEIDYQLPPSLTPNDANY